MAESQPQESLPQIPPFRVAPEQVAPISPPSQTGSPAAVFEARIQCALDLKNRGNSEFKKGDLQQAKSYYQQALAQLEPNVFYGASEAECLKMAELSANLLFNIGSCFFNESRWKQAELLYNEAITVNPTYTKAIYKRALARHQQGQFETAMSDIKQAFALDKTNSDIYHSYEKILHSYNEDRKRSLEKSKELSHKIFNSSNAKVKDAPAQQPPPEQKNNWWLMAMLPLAGLGLYQGIKWLRS